MPAEVAGGEVASVERDLVARHELGQGLKRRGRYLVAGVAASARIDMSSKLRRSAGADRDSLGHVGHRLCGSRLPPSLGARVRFGHTSECVRAVFDCPSWIRRTSHGARVPEGRKVENVLLRTDSRASCVTTIGVSQSPPLPVLWLSGLPLARPPERPHNDPRRLGVNGRPTCSANLTHWVTRARAQGLDAEAANVVAHLRVLDCRRVRTASGGPSCTSP